MWEAFKAAYRQHKYDKKEQAIIKMSEKVAALRKKQQKLQKELETIKEGL